MAYVPDKQPRMAGRSLGAIYRRMTLRTRITVSFVLLMAGAMGFIALVELVDYDQVRATAIAASQRDEIARLKSDLDKGIWPSMPEGSQLYDARSAPSVLRQHGLGYYGEETPEEWHLFTFEHAGQRYYLLQNGEYYDYLEHFINIFATLVILTCILCAFWIGRRTSAHVIAPITRLADAVQANQKPFPFQDARDEIGVLARVFAQHSNELEQFLQRERCFAGDASHELRTPLAIIGGAAETLQQQLPADHALMPSAERIVRTTQEMQRQLACLLLLSRDPRTLPRTTVSLLPLIEECMARCQPWLAGKPVELILGGSHTAAVHTNAELARSVIWNLLRNACQYTDEGQVRISMCDTMLVIADTGPGLPPSIDPQQFQRFLPSMRNSGEGLGLSIVQRIVEHLGWQMTVETSDQGCRFSLQMPAEALED